jgi:L-arginine dehydrogenase
MSTILLAMRNIAMLAAHQVTPPDITVLHRALRAAFLDLERGRALQPPQQVLPLPEGGDVITYQGLVGSPPTLAVKLSPYLPQPSGQATVTAWTVLIDLTTGDPVALLDSKALTAERTAGTTALAIDLLARADARTLALVGAGPLAAAHVRHALAVRAFDEIRVYSRRGKDDPRIRSLGPGVQAVATTEDAVAGADVVMLCTSAAAPVIDATKADAGALITSISTNAPRAHEIDPAALPQLDVYCDHLPSAGAVAAEMQIAQDLGVWSPREILGDLPGLLSGKAPHPPRHRPVFFRSVGLGIEDAVIAMAAVESFRKDTP